jgi:hypothetical protein
LRVVAGDIRPEVKAGGGGLHVQHGRENRNHGVEFFTIQRTIGRRVVVIIPRDDARVLGRAPVRAPPW